MSEPRGKPVVRGPFTVTSQREVYRNPWLSLREDRVIRPGGADGVFGVVDLVDGVSALAVDDAGCAWLVDEFKYALGRRSLEVVSGGIDPTETPQVAGARELLEELGIHATRWDALGHIDAFTNVVDSPNHLFLARGLTHGPARPDPGELITPVRMPLTEAVACAERGGITHSASVVLLLRVARLLGV